MKNFFPGIIRSFGLWIVVLFPIVGSAGHSTGNGGDAIVCRSENGKVISTRLYDTYEATEVDHLKIQLGPDTLSVEEKVKLALSRFRELNPAREKVYLEWLSRFEQERDFDKHDLVEIEDAGQGNLPKNCKPVQMIIQKPPTSFYPFRYRIQKHLWNAISKDDQALAILHELFYREASTFYEQSDSYLVRRFNVMLAADILPKTLPDYIGLLKELDYQCYEYRGMPLSTSFYSFSAIMTEQLWKGYLTPRCPWTAFSIDGNSYSVPGSPHEPKTPHRFAIELRDNGSPTTITARIDKGTFHTQKLELEIRNWFPISRFDGAGNVVGFDNSGFFSHGFMRLKGPGTSVSCDIGDPLTSIQFSPRGNVSDTDFLQCQGTVELGGKSWNVRLPPLDNFDEDKWLTWVVPPVESVNTELGPWKWPVKLLAFDDFQKLQYVVLEKPTVIALQKIPVELPYARYKDDIDEKRKIRLHENYNIKTVYIKGPYTFKAHDGRTKQVIEEQVTFDDQGWIIF